MSKMKTEQQLAVKDADEHRREMNEKRAAEEREAERQREEEQEKARQAEEDFKKNRKKYENEEALITARVEEEETKETAEASEDSSRDEVPRLDLQEVTTNNDKVSYSINPLTVSGRLGWGGVKLSQATFVAVIQEPQKIKGCRFG